MSTLKSSRRRPPHQHPFVLLRSNDICFLGIARGSAAAGVLSRPVCFDWKGAGPWYSEQSAVVCDPRTIRNPYESGPEAAADLVSALSSINDEAGTRSLLLGSSDTNLMFMLDHQQELRPLTLNMGSVAFDAMRPDVIRKDECTLLLERADVPVPRSFVCDEPSQIAEIVEQVPLPCIYKPAEKDYGQTFYARHQGLKAVEVSGRDELARALRQELEDGFRLIVQEKVLFDGPEQEIPFYLYADENHRIRMAATAVKELIQPYPFGTATVLRLTHHPELLEAAQKVVEALRWRGILMIEFILDQKDQTWKVIEVNARPWLFVDFFRRFGLNYLGYLHDDLAGNRGDWPELLVPSTEVLESSPVHISLPTAIAPRLEARGRASVEDVAAFLREISGTRSLTYLDPNDPAPGRAELTDLATRWQLDPTALVDAVQREVGDF